MEHLSSLELSNMLH